MKTNLETDWRDLLRRLAILLGMKGERSLDDARPDCGSDSQVDRGVELPSLAVLRYVDSALAGGDSVTAPICVLIDQLKTELRWRQNASYVRADFVADFLDGYAYCELLGPSGHRVRGDIALGLLLLAPRVTYPAHAHPAAEVYAVIAGRADWRQGDGVWRRREPGQRIHHASMEPHAMRTADEPLLAAYLWQDHLHEGARLLRTKTVSKGR